MKQITTVLHNQAKQIANKFLLTEGELLEVLSSMKKENSFLELGYADIFVYCTDWLNLSRAQAFYFKSVVFASEAVPELKEAVVQGELTLSQARRIAPVVTASNKTEWIEKAKSFSQIKLEQAVTIANPNAKPREKIKPITPELNKVSTYADNETKEDIEVLTAILSSKRKKPVSYAEVLAWMAHEMREKHDPEQKAARSISSANAKVPSLGRHAIPSATRHEVIRKYGNRCCYKVKGKRCEQTRWLHFHHRIEVAKGGLNTVENLVLLCSGHHRLVHSPNQKNKNQKRVSSGNALTAASVFIPTQNRQTEGFVGKREGFSHYK